MSRTNDSKLRLQIIGHKQWLLGECAKTRRSFETLFPNWGRSITTTTTTNNNNNNNNVYLIKRIY